MKKCLMGLALAALVAGCTTPTTRIDLRNDMGPQVAGLDYRDVQQAAKAAENGKGGTDDGSHS